MDERIETNHVGGITRRTVLAGTALASVGALAGCLGEDDGEDLPEPITIESGQICDNCTMEIIDYPGPVGEMFYEDPEAVLDGDDRPAQFCSAPCTYTFLFDNEADQEPVAIYLTDYSSVDYTIDEDGADPEISSHPEAEAFALAPELTQVVDSEVYGAMGRSVIGFTDADDAEAFIADYGGDEYAHEDIDQQVIMALM